MKLHIDTQNYFHSYCASEGQNGEWCVWRHNASTPYIIASFDTQKEATEHAVYLNAVLWAEKHEYSYADMYTADREAKAEAEKKRGWLRTIRRLFRPVDEKPDIY